MAFVPAANCALVELIQSLDGQVIENTFWVENGAGWNTTNLLTLAGVFKTWWGASWDIRVSSDLSLDKIKCTDHTTQTGPSIETVTGLPLTGAAAAGAAPNNVAVCVSFLTAQRGRAYRGRVYMAGFQEAIFTNSRIPTANAALYEADFAQLNTDLTTAGFTHVVVSRYPVTGPRVAAIVTPITDYHVDLIVDSQRRRLPGRGR